VPESRDSLDRSTLWPRPVAVLTLPRVIPGRRAPWRHRPAPVALFAGPPGRSRQAGGGGAAPAGITPGG